MITLPQIIILTIATLLVVSGSKTGNFATTEWWGFLGMGMFMVGILWNFIVKLFNVLVEMFRNGG